MDEPRTLISFLTLWSSFLVISMSTLIIPQNSWEVLISSALAIFSVVLIQSAITPGNCHLLHLRDRSSFQAFRSLMAASCLHSLVRVLFLLQHTSPSSSLGSPTHQFYAFSRPLLLSYHRPHFTQVRRHDAALRSFSRPLAAAFIPSHSLHHSLLVKPARYSTSVLRLHYWLDHCIHFILFF